MHVHVYERGIGDGRLRNPNIKRQLDTKEATKETRKGWAER